MIYDCLKEQCKEDILFCDRTGKIISVYLTGEVKVMFTFHSEGIAKDKYRIFRRELEGIRVG